MKYFYGLHRHVYIESNIGAHKFFRKRIKKIQQSCVDMDRYGTIFSTTIGRRAIDGEWFIDRKTSYTIVAYEEKTDDDYAILIHPKTGDRLSVPLEYIEPKEFLTEQDLLVYAGYHLKCPYPKCQNNFTLVENKVICKGDKHTFILERINQEFIASYEFDIRRFSYSPKNGSTEIFNLQTGNSFRKPTPDFASFYKLISRFLPSFL